MLPSRWLRQATCRRSDSAGREAFSAVGKAFGRLSGRRGGGGASRRGRPRDNRGEFAFHPGGSDARYPILLMNGPDSSDFPRPQQPRQGFVFGESLMVV